MQRFVVKGSQEYAPRKLTRRFTGLVWSVCDRKFFFGSADKPVSLSLGTRISTWIHTQTQHDFTYSTYLWSQVICMLALERQWAWWSNCVSILQCKPEALMRMKRQLYDWFAKARSTPCSLILSAWIGMLHPSLSVSQKSFQGSSSWSMRVIIAWDGSVKLTSDSKTIST